LSETDQVKGTFETDPISALGLPTPVSIGTDASVGAALAAVQSHHQGYVLVVENGKPQGIMSEREVLMKVVARDVKYDSNVMGYVSPIRHCVTMKEPIASVVRLMLEDGVENVPVVDAAGKAVAVARTLDIIHFLAQAFPEETLNLPPNPNQVMLKPEGG
jgi:CBS domain-containing protein